MTMTRCDLDLDLDSSRIQLDITLWTTLRRHLPL